MALGRNDPLTALPGIGPAKAKALSRLGLTRVGDLLGYFPQRYEDRRQCRCVLDAPLGESCCVAAMVAEEPRISRVRRGLELVKARAVDDTGVLHLTFFNQAYVKNALRPGETYIFYGKAEAQGRARAMANPVFERAGAKKVTGLIMPVYHLTAGVSNNLLAGLTRRALDACAAGIRETIPEDVRLAHRLCQAEYAYRNIHYPEDFRALELARRRMIFEELLTLTCGLALLKERRSAGDGRRLEASRAEFVSLLPFAPTAAQSRAMADIAADLSSGRAMNRLVQGDVGSGKTAVAAFAAWAAAQNGCQCAMMAPTELLAEQHARTLSALLAPAGVRVGLLTGSVKGAPRRALLSALSAGELDVIVGTHALFSEDVVYHDLGLVIADEQHRFGVAQRAALAAKGATPGAPPQVGRRDSGEGRGNSLPAAANEIGSGDPAAQTHCGEAQRAALAAKGATPGAPPQVGRRDSGEGRGNSLPAAANEIGSGDPTAQARCGEDQRAALAAKGAGVTGENAVSAAHILVMSATPIPRTLALIIYGDLDVSAIDELPPGRTPVATYVVGEDKRQRMYGFVRTQVRQGRQVYIVCPAVEEGEEPEDGGAMDLKAVTAYTKELQERVFPELRVGLVHGRLKPKEKEAVMAAFAAGELDVLVSTTVIEVGVDVPNASLMIVENAERFGLSQLHQLRGRVGRGSHQSYCVLVTASRSDAARERLRALCATNDGFKIAQEDLRLRGPGDFFGRRQHGLPQLKVADLADDMALLQEAKAAAETLIEADPGLSKPEHRALRRRVAQMFAQEPEIFN